MYVNRGAVSGDDSINTTVQMTRLDVGGRVLMDKTPSFRRVPFVLGPLQGVAYVSDGNTLETSDGAMTLSFHLELVPNEQITLAQALEAFFGAEVLPDLTEEST